MIKKIPVLLAGASGHLKVVIDCIEKQNEFDILGLLDPHLPIGSEVLGHKVVGRDEDLPMFVSKNIDIKLFVGIGDNWLRQKVVSKLMNLCPKIDFISAVHPSAQIGKAVKVGKGVVIMAGAIVNSDTSIGDFCIVNTNASVDHDCIMEEFSSLAPNVALGGNVTIGAYSAISIGAIIKHRVIVGEHSIIGAGSLLLTNCGNSVIMYGIPAKEIRTRDIGDSYLH